MYIDTHCHLDSAEYAHNLATIIENAKNLGVGKIIIPGADIRDLPRAIKISEAFEGVFFAVGIHPNEVESFSENAEQKLESALLHPKCVAVGEVGLDYHYLEATDASVESHEHFHANAESRSSQRIKQHQERVFRFHIELAIAHDKPLIIHTRDSNSDTIAILRDYKKHLKAVIFHCFGGDLGLRLECPCYYGIGGVVSFKNAHTLRENLTKIPLDSLLLETDAPYLAPTPHRGKVNTPEFIPLIASHLADCLNMDIADISKATTKNANEVFGLAQA